MLENIPFDKIIAFFKALIDLSFWIKNKVIELIKWVLNYIFPNVQIPDAAFTIVGFLVLAILFYLKADLILGLIKRGGLVGLLVFCILAGMILLLIMIGLF